MNYWKLLIKPVKKRRETIANNAGFDNAEEYLKHLQSKIPITTKPIIHNVVILDASGSMHGAKFNNAVFAIDSEVGVLSNVKEIDYLYSRVIFSGHGGEDKEIYLKSLNDVPRISTQANGGTPLFYTIEKVINNLKLKVKEGERVLINIFTDGDDTNGGLTGAKTAVKLAKSKGWTVTFVGTAKDVKSMINTFELDESNTLIHDNTAESVRSSLNTTTAAKLSYSKAVLDGASTVELQSNFYKRTGKL